MVESAFDDRLADTDDEPRSEADSETAEGERTAGADRAGAPPDGGSAEGTAPADVGSELEVSRQRVLRLQAELENLRKRARRELDERLRYANMSLMKDLLPVLDNIDRAIGAAEHVAGEHVAGERGAAEQASGNGGSGLLEGVKLVARQLVDVLAAHHCTPIDALHTPFDPNHHEAISQLPSDEHTAGTVTQVTQTGYHLHDRIVRPSQVIVAAPSKEPE